MNLSAVDPTILADLHYWRIDQLNHIMVDLGALDMPEDERRALWDRLRQLDDVGIALLRKALKSLQKRRVAAS